MPLHMLPSRPPPEAVQKVNRILHQEPFGSVAYAFVWSFYLCAIAPLGGFALLLRLFYQVVGASLEKKKVLTDHHELSNLAVVVTGCDSGFGKDLAVRLAEEGYQVFAGCLQLEESQKHFSQFSNVKAIALDVTSKENVASCVEDVQKWLDQDGDTNRSFYALVNNAGMGRFGHTDWLTMGDFEKCFDVNTMGPIRMCKAFMPILKLQQINRLQESKNTFSPRIINVSSVAGMVPCLGMGAAAYGSSKHALDGFTQAFRYDMLDWGVHGVSINPSFHDTPLLDKTRALTQDLRVSNDLRQEYGSDYVETFVSHINKCMTMGAWDSSVVVESMVRTIEDLNHPPQIVVGMDAKYMLMITRMLPEWCSQLVTQCTTKRRVPIVMTPKTNGNVSGLGDKKDN